MWHYNELPHYYWGFLTLSYSILPAQLFFPSLYSPLSPPSFTLSVQMGDVGRPFRPIAPRTMPPGGGPDDNQPPGGGGPGDDGRVRRASTACKLCQKRRTKVPRPFPSSPALTPIPTGKPTLRCSDLTVPCPLVSVVAPQHHVRNA